MTQSRELKAVLDLIDAGEYKLAQRIAGAAYAPGVRGVLQWMTLAAFERGAGKDPAAAATGKKSLRPQPQTTPIRPPKKR